MEVQAKFKIIYSDEIIRFLNTLEIKARSKILYNINKCKYIVDKSLFKKLANTDIVKLARFRMDLGRIM